MGRQGLAHRISQCGAACWVEQLALTCYRCGGAQTEDTYSNVDTVKDTEDKMRCVKLFGTLNTHRLHRCQPPSH